MILTKERTLTQTEYDYWIKQSGRIFKSLPYIRNDLEYCLGVDMCRFTYEQAELHLDIMFASGERKDMNVTDILREVYSEQEAWEYPLYERICKRVDKEVFKSSI